MAAAIGQTFSSIVGSSLTTVAGFVAICFMSFTLGRDLGIVMSKGVILGVLGTVTLLPCVIRMMDNLITKTSHKPLLPRPWRASAVSSSSITRRFARWPSCCASRRSTVTAT